MTYKDFITGIRRRIWVTPGEPRNLRDAHTEMFKQAMIDLGKWVEILRTNNTSVFPACSSYVECGKTIVDSPLGLIKRVYTIANDEWCDLVFYWQSNHKALDCLARNLIDYCIDWEAPANVGLPALQQGIKYAEASTDSPYGRARIGDWAIWRNRLYVFPWLQSNESLVVEWDGYKKDWRDEDVIDTELWGPDAELAIESYVRWQHELKFGDPQRGELYRREYNGHPGNPGGQLGDLIYWSKRLQEQRDAEQPCITMRGPTTAEVEDDAIPAVTPDSQFAIIGDFGKPTNGTAEADVATLVRSWDDGKGKFFIVTVGDNIYTPTVTYEEAVEPFYGSYVTDDLTTNRFWPAIGNHDRNDPTGGLQAYFDYFTLPNNERYYDFVKGATHFFILHSALQSVGATPPEADGLSSTSKQAKWLQAKLALSTAKWKIVVVQDSPYTRHAVDWPGHTILRWPFKDWGADILLTGDVHAYERLEVSGFPYINAGVGGTNLEGSFNADAGDLITPFIKFSQLGMYGALRCAATCETLLIEYVGLAGTVIDSLTLTKPA